MTTPDPPGPGASRAPEEPRPPKRRRPRRLRARPRKLTEEVILAWCDDHRARTGEWPTSKSGPVLGSSVPGETWKGVNDALVKGLRKLPGGSSLARLLAARRGVRNRKALPPLTEELILRWADAHFARHGKYPSESAGPVEGAGGGVEQHHRGAAAGAADAAGGLVPVQVAVQARPGVAAEGALRLSRCQPARYMRNQIESKTPA